MTGTNNQAGTTHNTYVNQTQPKSKPEHKKDNYKKDNDSKNNYQSTLNRPASGIQTNASAKSVKGVGATDSAKKEDKSVGAAGRTMKERGDNTDKNTYRNTN